MKKEIEEIIYMLNNNLKYWHQNLAGTKEQDFAHVEHLLNKAVENILDICEAENTDLKAQLKHAKDQWLIKCKELHDIKILKEGEK